jgi:hypothetical protein
VFDAAGGEVLAHFVCQMSRSGFHVWRIGG